MVELNHSSETTAGLGAVAAMITGAVVPPTGIAPTSAAVSTTTPVWPLTLSTAPVPPPPPPAAKSTHAVPSHVSYLLVPLL